MTCYEDLCRVLNLSYILAQSYLQGESLMTFLLTFCAQEEVFAKPRRHNPIHFSSLKTGRNCKILISLNISTCWVFFLKGIGLQDTEFVVILFKIADAVAAALSPPYNCFENSKACKPFRCHSFELQDTIILLQGP